MRKTNYQQVTFLCIVSVLCMVIALAGCDKSEKQEYYKDKSNYITVNGTVESVYSYNNEALLISFSYLDHKFSASCFQICGKNLPIVQEKGIDYKLKAGDSVVFTTAPGFFGDGYIMPIVAITVDGEELLSFDEGYENLLDWIG